MDDPYVYSQLLSAFKDLSEFPGETEILKYNKMSIMSHFYNFNLQLLRKVTSRAIHQETRKPTEICNCTL